MTTDSTDKIEVELKDYRQPLVTSLGIILGFMLSYLAARCFKTGPTSRSSSRS